MEIPLHPSHATSVTTIPNLFIDRYMREANGEYVKIYLYLLRHLGGESLSFNISKLAEDLDHTQRDVKRALRYWEKQNLLHLEYDADHELSGVYMMDPPSETIVPIPAPSPIPLQVLEPVVPVPAEDNATFSELLYMTERLIRHPLSGTTIDTIRSWHEELGLSVDLIEYLIESCAEKQRTNIKYMNQIALSWANEGITTVEEAKLSTLRHQDTSYAVLNAFGIKGRQLTDPELSYINKWTKVYGFSTDIIKEACGRTILSIHTPSFEYTDTILKNWSENKASTLADIEILDKQHSKQYSPQVASVKNFSSEGRFINFSQRSDYDYEALQRKLSGS